MYVDKIPMYRPRGDSCIPKSPIRGHHMIVYKMKTDIQSFSLECTFILSAQDNLDASTSSDQSESSIEAFSDPVHGLHASKPKDFVVFINLVDFCRYTSYFSLY